MGGHLELLQWAHEQGCPLNAAAVCQCALLNEHVEIEQWVKEQEDS
jgi:hypothetical protein